LVWPRLFRGAESSAGVSPDFCLVNESDLGTMEEATVNGDWSDGLRVFEFEGVTPSGPFWRSKSINAGGEGFGDGRAFRKFPIGATESQPSKMSSLDMLLLVL